MNLRIETITEQSADLPQIQKLYLSAFPKNERRPLGPILRDTTGCGEVLAFYDGALFCGFACLLTEQELSHIIYFAIEPSLRNRGYGAKALACMLERKKGMRVIVDIEAENEAESNFLQRQQRRQFYLRNGFAPTPIRYQWRQEVYDILSCGGSVSEKEFRLFWHRIYDDAKPLFIY